MASILKDFARMAGFGEEAENAEAALTGAGSACSCCTACNLGGCCLGPDCFARAADGMDMCAPYAELLGRIIGCMAGPCVFPIVYCFAGEDTSGLQPWDVSMEGAPLKQPGVCCCNMCCICCTQFGVRYKVLNSDMSKYKCFQGFADGPYCCAACSPSMPFTFTAGSYGEKDCPYLCLCCEVTCCPLCAFHVSREWQRGERRLGYDPTEIKVDRCLDFFGGIAHCCFCAGCCLKCTGCLAGCCLGEADYAESSDRLGNALLHIAHGIYQGMRWVILIASSCMSAQMIHEAGLPMPGGDKMPPHMYGNQKAPEQQGMPNYS